MNILQECIENEMKHKLLFEQITRRGPKAYDILLNICDRYFKDAALILKRNDISLREERVQQAAALANIPRNSTENHNNENNEEFLNFTTQSSIEPIILQPYTSDVTSKLNLVVKKSSKIHINEKVPTYSMKSRNRGVLFLVNIINFKQKPKERRNGGDMDRDNLISLFRQMGFQIFYNEDITKTVSEC